VFTSIPQTTAAGSIVPLVVWRFPRRIIELRSFRKDRAFRLAASPFIDSPHPLDVDNNIQAPSCVSFPELLVWEADAITASPCR